MAKEKKTENNQKKTGQHGNRRSLERRDRFVDSFHWGFVDGDEARDFNSDDKHLNPKKDKRKTDLPDKEQKVDKKPLKKKDIESSSNKLKDDVNRPTAKKSSNSTRKSPKKIVPDFPSFIDDEDDDDLNLPSYGRTPVPADDELPQPISATRKAGREREQNKKTSFVKNTPNNAAKNPVKGTKKNVPEKDSVRNQKPVLKTDSEKSSFVKSQTDQKQEPFQESRIARSKREQMVWDPEQREYVPLVVSEPSGKTVKKVQKNNLDKERKAVDSSVSDKDDSKNFRKRSFDDKNKESINKSETHTKDSNRKKKPYEKILQKEEFVQKDSKSVEKPRSFSRGDQTPRKERTDWKESKDSKSVENKISAAMKSVDTASESNESKNKDRKNRNRNRLNQQRADIPPMVESNVPDPADIESEAKGFARLGVSEMMLEALKMIRFLEPTPIQAGVFKQVKAGQDVMGQAQTGTGKTAAFSIPIIEGVEECPPGNDPVALILVPTRELAVQVRDEAVKLSYGRDIRISACYGGKPIAKQIARLKEGVDILVGTPGRILDLMNRRALSLDALRWVVLDEADRMLDIGFRPDIEKILRQTPKERQTLLFSATLAPPVVKLAEKYMKSPEVLDFSNKGIAVETIEQFYITVDQERKFDALVYLLNEQKPNQAIIFTRTKRGADRLARLLLKRFESLAAIHGDLSQGERDRVMGNFRSGKLRYLVATDVVGRGIDVSGISHIINYDIPAFCDDYVHRVGRTGRMGREGVAYTFVTVEEGAELTRIEMRIDKLLKRAELKGFETFAKPVDHSVDPDDEPSPPPKPVFGQTARKIRRAL